MRKSIVPNSFGDFGHAIDFSRSKLIAYGEEVDTGRWQGVPTEGKPDLVTREILDLSFNVNLDRKSWHDEGSVEWAAEMAFETGCNMEWADEHFAERVGGVPLNPDPSHVRWPWWVGQDSLSKTAGDGEKFTHTYSERFWPRWADPGPTPETGAPNRGIRYQYGDYDDVLELLAEDPYTRQAYLPIFFPEDTGAVHRGRIPCSLGYHFLLRGNRLNCWYEIRSCDAVRHFRDDLYLAARLVGHTLEQLFERELRSDKDQVWVDVKLGYLYFSCHSFHVHMGDYHRL